MNQYEKGLLVINYLQNMGLNMSTVGTAIEDNKLEKSYQTIKQNPKITKQEFLKIMGIEEVVY